MVSPEDLEPDCEALETSAQVEGTVMIGMEQGVPLLFVYPTNHESVNSEAFISTVESLVPLSYSQEHSDPTSYFAFTK